GVVFQQDLGATTLDTFREMTHYNPDAGWTEVDSYF
ncbi:MAG: hypothetical protein FD129_2018, partial [bacterium]